jgi:hypothetical protein
MNAFLFTLEKGYCKRNKIIFQKPEIRYRLRVLPKSFYKNLYDMLKFGDVLK